MKILLDTNRYTDFLRGVEEATKTIIHAKEVFVPFITLAELRAGFLLGTKMPENEAVLAQFLNSPRTSTLFPDEDTTHHHGQLFKQLRRQGTPIPTNDIWIAALAVQHRLTIHARDRHFHHLPQVLVI
jgi:tRNA(fMet)-specific endonuclease VapC